MTRDEAIKELKEYEDGLDLEYATPFDKAILYAIKVMEQEPILDKITELIEPLRHLSIDQMSDIEWLLLRMIDKYKAETEAEDGNDDC